MHARPSGPGARAEPRRRLRHPGSPPVPVEIVLERLIEFGYLDDEAFARAWVESRDPSRPRGASAPGAALARTGGGRAAGRVPSPRRAPRPPGTRGGAPAAEPPHPTGWPRTGSWHARPRCSVARPTRESAARRPMRFWRAPASRRTSSPPPWAARRPTTRIWTAAQGPTE